MDHFSPGDWIDFTRRLLPSGKAIQMQGHLERNCKECLQNSSFWGLVAELAAREAAYEPPSETVQEINAAYRSVRFVPRLREIASLARLVFDSFSQPSLAGIRAAAQASRQLIHESEPFTIDLRLEADAARKRIYLAGQIMNSRNPDEIAGGIDVVLLKGSDQISKTETLPSGEFELSFDVGNADDLELFLNIRGQRAIAIKLPELET